jgi:hypothetical protein
MESPDFGSEYVNKYLSTISLGGGVLEVSINISHARVRD